MSEKTGSAKDYTTYETHLDVYTAFDVSTVTKCTATKMTKNKLYTSARFCNGKPVDDGSGSNDLCEDMNTDMASSGRPSAPLWCDKCGYTGSCGPAYDASTGKTNLCTNIANRMIQKEALHHAQGAYFISIVIVQWADLLLCKTRWLSLRTQGMSNSTMNFGLFFETMLGGWLCYQPGINMGLGTRNIRFTHWLPGIPWSCLIFTYDEVRKYLMRSTSPESVDKSTGQIIRVKGWLERNTYY
jgi:sodium/potassium-transporting ATPase subunit alpha